MATGDARAPSPTGRSRWCWPSANCRRLSRRKAHRKKKQTTGKPSLWRGYSLDKLVKARLRPVAQFAVHRQYRGVERIVVSTNRGGALRPGPSDAQQLESQGQVAAAVVSIHAGEGIGG